MNDILKIGDFAQLNDISVQALRHYEKVGLLRPARVDEQSGYRYYHINQSGIVDSIQYLKQFGFSLRDIVEILNQQEDLTELSEKIEHMRCRLLAEKRLLEQKLREIDRYQQGALCYRDKRKATELELCQFPVRNVYVYRIASNIYDMTDESYERQLRLFKCHAAKQSWRLPAFSKVGSLIRQEDFAAGHFYSDTLFIQSPNGGGGECVSLKKGRYALRYCRSFGEEITTLPVFRQQILERGLTVCGDYVCEVIYEHTNPKKDRRELFIRMQVPVGG